MVGVWEEVRTINHHYPWVMWFKHPEECAPRGRSGLGEWRMEDQSSGDSGTWVGFQETHSSKPWKEGGRIFKDRECLLMEGGRGSKSFPRHPEWRGREGNLKGVESHLMEMEGGGG